MITGVSDVLLRLRLRLDLDLGLGLGLGLGCSVEWEKDEDEEEEEVEKGWAVVTDSFFFSWTSLAARAFRSKISLCNLSKAACLFCSISTT